MHSTRVAPGMLSTSPLVSVQYDQLGENKTHKASAFGRPSNGTRRGSHVSGRPSRRTTSLLIRRDRRWLVCRYYQLHRPG